MFVGGGVRPTGFEHHHLQQPCAIVYNRHQRRESAWNYRSGVVLPSHAPQLQQQQERRLVGAHLQESPQIAMGWFDAGNDKDSLAQVKEVPSHPQLVGSQAGGCFHAHTEVLVLKLHAPHLSH